MSSWFSGLCMRQGEQGESHYKKAHTAECWGERWKPALQECETESIWENMRVGLHLTNSVAKLVIITSTRCTTEDEMAGWHHWLDGHEFGWTPGVGDGQGGLACCDSWGRKESDTTERLIWSDLIWSLQAQYASFFSDSSLCFFTRPCCILSIYFMLYTWKTGEIVDIVVLL